MWTYLPVFVGEGGERAGRGRDGRARQRDIDSSGVLLCWQAHEINVGG